MSFFGKKKEDFWCPVNGKIIPLSEVKDPVFAEGMLGTGFAIEPTEGKLYSPVAGEVTVAFPTGHAFGIKTNLGLEMIIHIGIDTVELNGEVFYPKCKQGDFIEANDLLVEFSLEKIREFQKDPVCVFLFPNKESISLVETYSTVISGTKNIVKIK